MKTPSASTAETEYEYLFGPVPSRRLGRSLGVDLVPLKTCSYDCVFCQIGRTSGLTLERREYVPVEDVLAELERWLRAGGSADTITLSGSGEPTLHSRFGEVLEGAGRLCDTRRTLLSNGSLMYLPEVRRAAAAADVVKVSLSAWDQPSFETINRPHGGLQFDAVAGGLRRLGAEFEGELWLEVFVLPGVNSDEESMRRIAAIASDIAPARIHLNTAVRPPCEEWAEAAAVERLEAFAALFEPRAEVIADYRGKTATQAGGKRAILAMLARRPCSAEDVAASFGLAVADASMRLEELAAAGEVKVERREGRDYYHAVCTGLDGGTVIE